MQKSILYQIIFTATFLLVCLSSTAQQLLTVKDIEISGNRKTKKATILREMSIHIGDTVTVTELPNILATNRLQLLNTGLFILVKMNISSWETTTAEITITVDLQENWYIYPTPIFELADRNFNVWWVEQNRSFSRVDYGLRLYHINLTGRRDRLKLVTQFGFTQKFELDYRLPAFDNNQNLGFTAESLFAENKNLAYQTFENRRAFDKFEDRVLLRRFRFGGGLTYRKGIFQYHSWKVKFHHNTINDFVPTELNNRYFLDGKNRQRYFSFSYQFGFDNRNFKPYPSAGQRFRINIQKSGFGIFNEMNSLYLTAAYDKYFPFGKKFNLEILTKGRVAILRGNQPYNQSSALGFLNDFIRGYEYYVMDGLDFGYVKTAFRFKFFDKYINWGRYMLIPQFRIMPFKMYLSIHNDVGITNNPQFGTNNSLSNTLLWGGGIGLDFVYYNDKIIQLQYSVNHLGENGLFLHYQLNF